MNRNYPKREMTQIKCDDCGADSQVPFVPTAGRPIYCPACWRKRQDQQKADSAKRLGLTKSGYFAEPEAPKQ